MLRSGLSAGRREVRRACELLSFCDELCRLGHGPQCLWPVSASHAYSPSSFRTNHCSRASQHQRLPLLNAHICCLSITPWHKPLSSSFCPKAKAHKHSDPPLNNQLINFTVSWSFNSYGFLCFVLFCFDLSGHFDRTLWFIQRRKQRLKIIIKYA